MKIAYKYRVISPIQHEQTIESEWDEVFCRIPDIIKEFRTNSTFDGFRKGKAPESVAEDQKFHIPEATLDEKRMFYRMGVRHYSTSFGRFMQRDPI